MDKIRRVVALVVKRHADFERDNGPLGEVAGYPHDGTDSFINVAHVVSNYLAPRSRILDFGAGRCLKAAVLAELGYEVTAFDDFGNPWHTADPARRDRIIRFATNNGVKVITSLDDAPRVNMSMLHDVLEHLPDSPRPILERLLGLTDPKGYLFVTVPNAVNLRKRLAVIRGATNHASFTDYYWHEGPHWRGHVREYVRDDLSQLARFLDLDVLELRSCHHMLHKIPRIVHPLFRLSTRAFPGWRDTWLLVGRKQIGGQSSKFPGLKQGVESASMLHRCGPASDPLVAPERGHSEHEQNTY